MQNHQGTVQDTVNSFVCPIYASYQYDAIPFHILPQGVFVLPGKILGVLKQQKDQMIYVLEYKKIVI